MEELHSAHQQHSNPDKDNYLSRSPSHSKSADTTSPGQASRPETLRPYSERHNRRYDFSEFEKLGRGFICAFAANFVLFSSSLESDTAQSRFNSIRHFLRWLVANVTKLSRLISALRTDHTKVLAHDWEDAYELWKGAVISEPKKGPGTKYILIKNARIVLNKMAAFGVIPKLSLSSASTKLLRHRNPRKNLAEVSPHSSHIKTSAISKGSPSEIEQTGRDSEASGNARVFNSECVGPKTDKERASVYLQTITERLNLLRGCASRDFLRWRDHWTEGQRLLGLCDMSFEEINALISSDCATRKKTKILAEVFPTESPEISLSRLITFLTCGLSQSGRMTGSHGSSAERVKMLVSQHGGVTGIKAYQYPHQELTIALVVIILCDTGANVGVVRTLPYDCLSDTEDHNYKTITGVKVRARGKLIADELPVKDPLYELSCVDAIHTYQKISEKMRSLAIDRMPNLFLCQDHLTAVRPLTKQALKAYFRRFCERHIELRGLGITPATIRPSVQMQAAFDKEGGLIRSNALADHTFLSTTISYISRFESRAIWEQKIREFQTLFQATSIYSIQGAARKLGLTTQQVERLYKEASRTGLGVSCLDPRGGVQAGSKKGELCTQLEACPTCPNAIVVATEQNIKDVILWNKHLNDSRKDWETNRPDRWTRVWLPWLVFTQVIIEQASRGRTVGVYMRAKALAERLISDGQVKLPPLW